MDLSQIEQKLNFYIRTQYFPVAVKLLKQGEEIPEKARFPMRDFGHAIMACQGIGMARRYGWTVAMGKEDIACAGAAVGLGFVKKEELHAPQGMSIPFVFNCLKYGKYRYFVVAPLHSAAFTPDVIAIYGNSAQLMRLTQAFIYLGKVVDGIATAEASCAEIATTSDSANPRCILPSGGDRVFGTTQDFEMLFTIPWAKVNDTISGLEYTHKMGIRYPIVAALRYKPEPPAFLDLEKMKTG